MPRTTYIMYTHAIAERLFLRYHRATIRCCLSPTRDILRGVSRPNEQSVNTTTAVHRVSLKYIIRVDTERHIIDRLILELQLYR